VYFVVVGVLGVVILVALLGVMEEGAEAAQTEQRSLEVVVAAVQITLVELGVVVLLLLDILLIIHRLQ
jgi:hypothetical protein